MKRRMVLAIAAPVAFALALLAARPAQAAPPPAADPFFGKDKALHFGFSAALVGVGYGGAALVGFDHRADRAVLGASLAIGAGFTKEVLDAAGLGTPSWKDFAWDVLGALAGVGISISIDYATQPRRPAALAR
jgi:putative lipoprotein